MVSGGGFVESGTWQGGSGTGDELKCLGPSLGHCTRKQAPKPAGPEYQPIGSGKQVGEVTYYNAERGFGRIAGGLFFHVKNVVDGNTPYIQRGVKVAYEEGFDTRSLREQAVGIQLVP